MRNILSLTVILIFFCVLPAFADANIDKLIKDAESGDALAQHSLGAMYFKGVGVPKDSKKAAVSYEKAAMQGDDKAQFMLGFMYETGNGVRQDNAAAYAYYNISASAGNAKAVEYRDKLQKKMTPAQIEKAQNISPDILNKINEKKK